MHHELVSRGGLLSTCAWKGQERYAMLPLAGSYPLFWEAGKYLLL